MASQNLFSGGKKKAQYAVDFVCEDGSGFGWHLVRVPEKRKTYPLSIVQLYVISECILLLKSKSRMGWVGGWHQKRIGEMEQKKHSPRENDQQKNLTLRTSLRLTFQV